MTVLHSISDYAKALDAVEPGWEHKVNQHTLDMSSTSKCILGQALGGYFEGLTLLENNGYDTQNVTDALCSNEYLYVWTAEISNRLEHGASGVTFSLADLRTALARGKSLTDLVDENTEVQVTLTRAEIDYLRGVLRTRSRNATAVNITERLANA